MNNPARLAFSILASLILVGCGDSNSGGGADGTEAAAADRPRVAYVTNGVADFWTIAKAGANTAGDDFDVSVDVLMPTGGVTDQKRMVEDLITTQVDGSDYSDEEQTGLFAIVPVDFPADSQDEPADPLVVEISRRRRELVELERSVESRVRSPLAGYVACCHIGPQGL